MRLSRLVRAEVHPAAQQIKLLKAHPPRSVSHGDDFVIELFSPLAGKYIAQTSGSRKVAHEGIEAANKMHRQLLEALEKDLAHSTGNPFRDVDF